MRTIEEIEQRRAEIVTESKSAVGEQLDALLKEMEALKEERSAIETADREQREENEKRRQLLEGIADGSIKARTVEKAPEERGKTMERILTPDMPEYRDLFFKNLMGKPMTEVEKREYDLLVTTSGAAAVPTLTADKIFDAMTKIAPLLNEITLMRVPGSLRFAVQGTRNAAAVHAENAAVGLAADTLTAVTLTGYEFIKVISVSATMQAMSIPAFENWIVKILAEDIAVDIDQDIIYSAATTGGIDDGPWNEGVNQITYVPANGLSHANVIGLIALLPAAFDSNAKWLMSRATFWNQFYGMEDANGNPIINEDLTAGARYVIRGYPVLIDDNVTVNEAYFGDFSKVVGNLSQDISIARDTSAGFLAASTYYRGLAVFDCDVAQPAAIVKLNVA